MKNNELNNNNFKGKKLNNGFIIDVLKNEGIIISTKTDPILLVEAKLEGKNISSKNQLIQQLNPKILEKFSD